jgi:ParB family chromosome partitioning protein
MAGIAEIPAIVHEGGERDRMELALIENLQREDLSPLEEAEAYRRLLDEHGLTQEDLARRVGKSRPAIANALRLLGLPEEVKARLRSGEISAGHARAILSVPGVESQVDLAREIVLEKLPKSAAERMAAERRGRAGAARPRGSARAAAPSDPNWRAVAEDLTRRFGTRVRLTKRARGGTIEIEFYSDAELDRLVHELSRSDR